METDFLRTLLRVAELGSMAQAARSLDITPAAVAHQVRSLELSLGAALVVRSGRTVLPTAAGHRLLERVRPLLTEVMQLRSAVQGPSYEGQLNVGAINTVLHTVFAAVLERFAQRYPQVRLLVHAGMSQPLLEQVQQGRLDVAMCLHPQFELPKTLGWAPLREEPLMVLAPASLAAGDPLELLQRQPFIRYDRSLGGGRQADAYLRAHGIVTQERIELSSLLAIAMMVDRGLGVSLVPRIDSPLTAALHTVHIPLPDPPPPRAFGVLWQRAGPREPLVQAFRLVAAEAVR
ncbi:LysR family transcriptional regulator [Corticibacter populi]|uniref:LysR family transcriptional regulator n=1 Tax=Corticibacter populi TaxID=1550736 RepID=A0A3M6QV67_9BURK|nr:LysR substrate-binding domain-containing protein [Corticibacter populi]RMX06905.1 LysR family transcriptional regulator [Corticibacter populi]RZS31941.1 DNA-binding transcriptional LysR family regulator [Corticibacter populi]